MSSWIIYSLLSSFCVAFYFLQNQNIKLNGLTFMVYRGWIVGLLLLPFIGCFEPVSDWRFYLICVGQGLLIAFVDYRFFISIRKWGAEVSTSLQPLTVGITFIIWLLSHPSIFEVYFNNLPYFVAVVLCMSGIIFSVHFFNRASVSKEAFHYLLPVLAVCSIIEAVNKTAMSYGSSSLISASYYYIMITGFTAGVVNLGLYVRQKGKLQDLLAINNIKYTWVFAILILSMLTKNFAMFNTPNPAYVSALIYVYILWILLINNIKTYFKQDNVYKKMDVRIVLLLLMSVVTLIIVTGNRA